jgi:murein DD-endopeptidase MepM/ murein hydrolase activator NlpD
MFKKIFFSLLAAATLILALTSQAAAQETPPPSGPIYIIQRGDTLSSIAARFNISLSELMAANQIENANFISVGQRLVIPGLEGVSGLLDTNTLGFGETLQNISRRNQVAPAVLERLNRITSPSELYAGSSLIVPVPENFSPLSKRMVVERGQSPLEAAVLTGSDPWTIGTLNALPGTWSPLPGDVYYVPGEAEPGAPVPNGMPAAFRDVKIAPLPGVQGGTLEIFINTLPGAQLSGSLGEQALQFFGLEETDRYVAIQGIHALLDPGAYPLRLQARLADGSQQVFEQRVIVQSGFYPEEVLLVEPETIDPATTESEMALVLDLTSKISPNRLWNGIFKSPAYFNDCFTSRYGNRRTYIGAGTGEKYYSFHSGLDFCGGEGLPITAPANGVVVFAGPLTIRGNATIIDHGWGVFSGIWHQSQILVSTGQQVNAGDLIGYVGGTGRVTGAHLHWEVWANGAQVNPLDWLQNTYP